MENPFSLVTINHPLAPDGTWRMPSHTGEEALVDILVPVHIRFYRSQQHFEMLPIKGLETSVALIREE